ncbi:Alpha/Beta hydrolase protein [Talaromyces proteolyticus]|uniref:Alpha/Beta hydrolase protein n=1 Tax=Talaromyces proteolyticus TaxID=1131652 RepID=A0AAD4PX78_9EURO|nr:Alpha/Beta hydrolase protein [Talaromyces proteolyticus]KAH8692324.1 Alpha/Beta hydrolase protein [Talaromyces proteolyticus]
MTSAFTSNNTALTQTFNYQNATHSYTIKWRSLGNPASPPLIFIHGTPWSSLVWTPFALSLSRHFHVYLFDNPGFGESPLEIPLPGTTTSSEPSNSRSSKITQLDADLARQSQVFAALFHYWQASDTWAQSPHIIAHDHGGLMSLRAHLLHNCHYASLCLLNVVAIGPFGQPLFKAVADNPEQFSQLPDIAIDGILESYIRNASFYELSKQDMQMLKEPWLREGGKEGFIRQLCQANYRNTDAVEGRYAEVGTKLPVKIVWGKQDNWIPVETAYRLGEALRAKEVAVVENAGHLVMFDQPGQIGVELGRWLGAV